MVSYLCCGSETVLLSNVETLDYLYDGKCIRTRHYGVWNKEVSDIVYTTQGVPIRLNDEAKAQITNKYDGRPLHVYFRRPCGCCTGCLCLCGIQCCIDCTPVTMDLIWTQEIIFGRNHDESMMEGAGAFLADLFTCGVLTCCNLWRRETVFLNPVDVRLATKDVIEQVKMYK